MPIIHGSGDFAIQVREELLNRPYECVAVPLPPSFQDEVEAAVEQLPAISVVVQVDADTEDDDGRARTGLQLCADRPLPGGDRRLAHGARRADRACLHRPRNAAVRAGHPLFSGSLRTQASQTRAIRGGAPGGGSAPAARPERRSASPGWRPGFASWKRAIARSSSSARSSTGPGSATPTSAGWNRREPESFFTPIATYAVDPRTLIFALGELPYITGLYERGRRELLPDDNLSVDGVKEMVLDARELLEEEAPQDRPADHAAATFGLFSLHSQPVAHRPAADARPLHSGRGGPANGRRRLCPGAGRDGPIVPVRLGRRCRDAIHPASKSRGWPGWGSIRPSCPSGAPGRWSAACRDRCCRGGPAS